MDVVNEISERKTQKRMEACVKTNTFPPFRNGPSITSVFSMIGLCTGDYGVAGLDEGCVVIILPGAFCISDSKYTDNKLICLPICELPSTPIGVFLSFM